MEASSERVERRLATIFATDVAGYSRLMGQDEVGILRTLSAHREVMDRLIVEHGDRIANTAGDSVLVGFPSAADAVQCAVETQKALSALNSDKHPDCALCFRIGVHLGDVIIRGGDIFGDGVNIAARLQALTEPAGVCISGDLHRHVRKVLPLTFTNLGAQQVKNIEEPVTVYAVDLSGSAPTTAAFQPKWLGPLPLPDKPSIAVLPFINMSSDPEQDYFADGVVEDIITALSRVRWFFVIARNSSFTYKGKAVDVRQVGRELGVRYVLEGSIRRAGGRIRITGQLIEAASGRHVWADCLREGGLEDIFQLQDHITESVVGAVEPTVRFAEVERARAKPTESLDACDLYLRALPLHYSNNRERVAEAQKLLARATEIDCDYSLAKAFSALTTVIQTNQGWTSKAEQENGIRFAREAPADHRDDPVTLRCVGHALSYLAHEHDVGVAVLERALMLHSNSAEVHHSAGWVWNVACNGSKALEHFNRSMRLSPLDPEIGHTLMGLTFAQLLVGHDEEALETSKKAMAAMSTSLSPLRAAIIALIGLGYFDEAKRIGRSLFGIAPDFRVSSFHEVQPFQNKAFVDRYMTALRTAGLPE